MKYITFLVLVALALLVQSCEDWPPGHGTGGGNDKPSIVGSWAWVRSEGGFYPQTRTPATVGFDATLELKPDKSYTYLESNGEGDAGAYVLGSYQGRETITLHTMSMRPILQSDPFPVDENFVDFRGNDTLVLSGTGADMLTYTYARIR